MALIADAMDRPLTELKELNPAVLRSVAPAGTALHLPKGMVPMVEAAFDAVPANRRTNDSSLPPPNSANKWPRPANAESAPTSTTGTKKPTVSCKFTQSY